MTVDKLFAALAFWACAIAAAQPPPLAGSHRNGRVPLSRLLWQAAATGDLQRLQQFAASNPRELKESVGGTSVLFPLLSGWHQSIESLPTLPRDGSDFKASFNLLLDKGVDPSLGCPLLDALVTRNGYAAKKLLKRMPPAQAADCLTTFDSTGQGMLHAAAKTPSSGFARHLFRTSNSASSITAKARKAITSARRMLGLRDVPWLEPPASCDVSNSNDRPNEAQPRAQAVSKAGIDAASNDEVLSSMLSLGRTLNISAAEGISRLASHWLDMLDGQGRTALSVACANGRAQAAVAFIKAGANWTVAGDASGNAACAHFAASRGYTSVLKAICSSTAAAGGFNETVTDGLTSITIADGDEVVLSNVCQSFMSSKDLFGRTAADVAALHGPLMSGVPQYLRGISANSTTASSTFSETPLEPASWRLSHFDLQRHIASGWAVASQQQLSHVGLPEGFFDKLDLGSVSYVTTGDAANPCACAWDVTSIPPEWLVEADMNSSDSSGSAQIAGLTTDLFRRHLSIGKPFVARRWAQWRSARNRQGQGSRDQEASAQISADGSTASGSAASELTSGYLSLASFTASFGDLAVEPGAVPYAATYDYGKLRATDLRSFVREHMGQHQRKQQPGSRSASDNSQLSDELLRPPYVFDGRAIYKEHRRFSEILSLFPPSLVPVGTGPGSGGGNQLRQLIVGPPLSGAMPHFHGSAVNVLLLGVKLWVLTPPAHAEFVQQHAADWFATAYPSRYCGCGAGCAYSSDGGRGGHRNATATAPADIDSGASDSSTPRQQAGGEGNNTSSGAGGVPHYLFLQEPGDLVWVPEHWGHAVLNLADSVAVAVE